MGILSVMDDGLPAWRFMRRQDGSTCIRHRINARFVVKAHKTAEIDLPALTNWDQFLTPARTRNNL